MKLLLVEPTQVQNSLMVQALRRCNNVVHCAGNTVMAADMLELDEYDVIIIDCQSSGEEGFGLLKTIRSQGIITPVIILSLDGDVNKCVEGLDSGADDFLQKPVKIEELLARIRALRRRNPEVYHSNEYHIRSCTFIPDQCLIIKGSELVMLKIKESMILEHLIRHNNQVVTREQLLQRIWGFNSDIEFNNIEVHISHLRKKLMTFQLDSCIQTIRGIGYCLSEGQVLYADRVGSETDKNDKENLILSSR